MRKTLRTRSTRFEILNRYEAFLEFRDITAALEFLRRFRNDPAQMAVLRSIVRAHSGDIHLARPEEVFKQFAGLLVSGRIKILKTLDLRDSGEADEPVEAEQETQGGRRARQTSWIEIYLRDMEGQPVPGKKYRIKLPDGVVVDGTLDAHGHAEHYGINPGTCEVNFPELDSEAWDRA